MYRHTHFIPNLDMLSHFNALVLVDYFRFYDDRRFMVIASRVLSLIPFILYIRFWRLPVIFLGSPDH